MKRAYFEHTKHSRICADHFTADCFQQNLAIRTSLGSTFKPRRLNLKKDAVPTIFHFEVKRKFGEEKVDPHKNKTAAHGNPEERVFSELFDQSQSCDANAREEPQETDTNPGLVDARRNVLLVSVGAQVSPENKDAVSQVYGKIVYDTSTQTTVTHQLQLRSSHVQTTRVNYRSLQTKTTTPKILSSAVQCSLTEDSLLKISQQKPVVSVKPEVQCDEECDDNASDTDSDSDAEYEDVETGDEDTKDETAPFGRKFLVFESNLFQLFQSCYKCLAPAMPRLDKTYCKIQRVYLAPVVSRCWENEQLFLLTSLKGKAIDLGGDARCDSPGHSAKYGTYHLVELNLNKVLAVELVQV
ncbi:hypothetical protein P5673_023192 [Acropora cervicornis]|uniref:THAP-type domain-containing protein n=1 Tax=Acropora cervicornis TaxID=6130 RepID=A0AAD9UZ21_ACRCE|nr:hypothetical protein P5673_023192 [Acropora cervicornis]